MGVSDQMLAYTKVARGSSVMPGGTGVDWSCFLCNKDGTVLYGLGLKYGGLQFLASQSK